MRWTIPPMQIYSKTYSPLLHYHTFTQSYQSCPHNPTWGGDGFYRSTAMSNAECYKGIVIMGWFSCCWEMCCVGCCYF